MHHERWILEKTTRGFSGTCRNSAHKVTNYITLNSLYFAATVNFKRYFEGYYKYFCGIIFIYIRYILVLTTMCNYYTLLSRAELMMKLHQCSQKFLYTSVFCQSTFKYFLGQDATFQKCTDRQKENTHSTYL